MPVSVPSAPDRSAALQQGTREFAGIYERNAYLVYNLALRITVDQAAAIEAACAAFLACLSSPQADTELPIAVVRRGLQLARQEPTPDAAGDTEAQALLRANARLAGPERAALALVAILGADATTVGAMLGMTESAAASLIDRAWTSFAAASSKPLAAAQPAYHGWLWAEPPAEVWEQLYPSFYEQLVRRLNASEEEAATATAAVVAAVARRPTRSERRRARRAERDARRARPPGRLRRAARAARPGRMALLIGILGACAGAAYATGLIGAKHARSTATTTGQQHRLSPAELARLRAEQRQAALEYAAQQRLAERQLRAQQALEQRASKQQRARALAAAMAAAKRRQAAIKRAKQLAARQQALQQQLLAQAQQPATAPSAPPPPSQSNSANKPSSSSSSGSGSGSGSGSKHGSGNGSGTSTNPTPSQVQQSCLYDANNGTWVCPQH